MKMKKWSSQWTQFMQLRKEAWKKFRTLTGFEPVTSRLPVRCSTNWAMKPLTLGAGQLWVHMFPWKKWLLFTLYTYSDALTEKHVRIFYTPLTSPPIRGVKNVLNISKINLRSMRSQSKAWPSYQVSPSRV